MKDPEFQGSSPPKGYMSLGKYPLIMAFLGALICAAIYWFVVYLQSGYSSVKWKGQDGSGMMEFGLHRFDLWGDALWPGLCFLIGLTLLVLGILHWLKIRRQIKAGETYSGHLLFSLTYVILGILLVGALLWYLGWLEPHWESVITRLLPDGREMIFYRDPVWIRWLISWKVISFLLALAVTGLGFIQLKSTRVIARGIIN
jgi:hypothetical protein